MKKTVILFAAFLGIVACGESTRQVPANNPVSDPGKVTTNIGKELFMGNCAQCHALQKDMTGPMVSGVITRWNNDTTKLIAFVKNSQQVIQAGGDNSYEGQLYNKWYKTVMPNFGGLTDADIMLILHYCQEGGK